MLHSIGLHIFSTTFGQVAVNSGGNRCRKSTVNGQIGKPCNMQDNHKLESCHSHEKKHFHDFPMTCWEIFIFQDFSMTFHDQRMRNSPDRRTEGGIFCRGPANIHPLPVPVTG